MKKFRDKLVRVIDFDNYEIVFLEIKLFDKFYNNYVGIWEFDENFL